MNKSPLKKVSQRELPKLKRKLWSLLAPLIKERDRKIRGRCITCHRQPVSYEANTGHCIPKSVCGVLLYFHPKNLALQCSYCNNNGLGEQGMWRTVIGERAWQELQDMREYSKGLNWTDFPFREAIEILKEGKLDKYEQLLTHLIK